MIKETNEEQSKTEEEIAAIESYETENRSEADQLLEEIKLIEARLQQLPENDVGTSQMNEDEIKESVKVLEAEYAKQLERAEGIRARHMEHMQTKAKLEAAIKLIAELEDEEEFLKEDLRTIRKEFPSTIRMLKNRIV